MTDNSARLIATLEARVSKFERDLAKANGTARREFGAIEKRGAEMAKRLEDSVGTAASRSEARLRGLSSAFNATFATFKAGLVGFAAGAAGAFSLEGVQASIADLAKLADTAERTGASAGFLQELAFAVEQSGGEAADAAAGMQKFAVNVSKAAAGGGDLAKLFTANGVALRDASGALLPVEELLRVVADLMTNAASEADRLNISTMAFGRAAGPAMVLALAEGRAGLAGMAADARKAGIVLGDELVKKAAKLDDQIALIARQMDSLGKAMLIEAGPAIAAGLELGLAKLRELKELVEAIRGMDLGKVGAFLMSRTGPGFAYNALTADKPTDERADLERKRASLQAQIAASESRIADATAKGLTAEGSESKLAKLKADLAEVEAQLKRINATPVAVDYTPSRAGYTAGAARSTIVPGEGDGKDSPFASGEAIRDFVRQVVKAESGGNASAKNPNSSATGAGQFIESTWLALFRKHYPEAAATMGRDAILALRNDADISRALIEEYAKENAEALRNAGVAVTSANLHLAHFLGPQGAINTVKAAPGAATSTFLGAEQIAANKSILQGKTREDVLAYADRRATDTRRAAGDFTPEEEAATKKAAAIARVVEALTREGEALGKTNEAERLRQALADAGVDADSAEGQRITAQVQRLYDLKAAQEATAKSARDLRQAREAWADAGTEATKGIVADLRNGASLSDAFANALDRLTQRLLDSAIDQAFAGLFGTGGGSAGGGLLSGIASLFGGARARGGPVRSGAAYLVGERGPELFAPGRSGSIIPNAKTAAMLAAPPALPKMAPVSAPAPVINVAGPSQPAVIIENRAPIDIKRKEERGGRGNRRERYILSEKVADTFQPGSAADKQMRGRYGARPTLVTG